MIRSVLSKLRQSRLFHDSFWAVLGNGVGNFLMLISGILIAKYLGKDAYGEYGMVKSTMYYIALFSTLSLGTTSTKFVAEYIQKNKDEVPSIVASTMMITFVFSLVLSFLLFLFSSSLSSFINAPQLCKPFRFLGIIIFFRALGTVCSGILGGYKDFRGVGINSIVSGVIMVTLCIPMTIHFGTAGALVTLLLSQVFLGISNLMRVRSITDRIETKGNISYIKRLINFSYPFAIAELVYSFSALGVNLLITKYASVGELGLFTACTQWNSIILFMPGLLSNVILSHLSSTYVNNELAHKSILRKMLLVNFSCTIIPFLAVYLLSPWISKYYGPSFAGMKSVLVIITLSTLFICLARVFQSELTSVGKKWTLMIIRCSYNILILIVSYVVLVKTNGENAAINMAYISVSINALSLALYSGEFHFRHKHENQDWLSKYTQESGQQ